MKHHIKLILIITISIVLSTIVNAQTDNYVLGTNAGANITTGDYNTFIGLSSGFSTTSGYENLTMGYQSGYSLSSGHRNVYLGFRTGYSSTSGNDNVYIGTEAGYSTTTGYDNVYIGYHSGNSNVNSARNTYIGDRTGRYTTVSDNTFIGYQTGHQNKTGRYNCFVGGYDGVGTTGFYNTTGSYNTAFGMGAMSDNSTGNNNTSIGLGAGFNSLLASDNTFVGYQTGYENNRFVVTNVGLRNTYLGKSAGYTNREGNDNVGIGANADFVEGAGDNSYISLGVVFTTIHNTVFVGESASVAADGVTIVGDSVSASGNNGIAIGKESSVTASNAIAIGYQATATTTNEVVIGNAAHTSIGGSVNWTATSDGRLKTDVKENVVGIEFIRQLRPVTYHFDSKKIMEHHGQSIPTDLDSALFLKNQIQYTGFIAQEVEAVAENVGYDFSGVDKRTQVSDTLKISDTYGIRYAEFVVPLVKTTQELSQKAQALVKENQQQQEQLIAYQTALENILLRLEALETSKQLTVGSEQ